MYLREELKGTFRLCLTDHPIPVAAIHTPCLYSVLSTLLILAPLCYMLHQITFNWEYLRMHFEREVTRKVGIQWGIYWLCKIREKRGGINRVMLGLRNNELKQIDR